MGYQVYIEKCRDESPETAKRLSEVIATRYGVAPEEILSRLEKGRFRIKANLELEAAKSFMLYLEESGALCSIIASSGMAVSRSSTLSRSPPVDTGESLDALTLQTPAPPPDSPPALSPQPTQPTPAPAPVIAEASEPGFGGMQLSTLDGIDPSTQKAPLDQSDQAFLPPDMAQEDMMLEVDRAPERTPVPPPSEVGMDEEVFDLGAPELDTAPNSPQVQPAAVAVRRSAARPSVSVSLSSNKPGFLEFLANNMRLRFGLGVMVSLLIGFFVMSPIASSREASRYDEPIAELSADYAGADTVFAWDGLEARASDTLDSLKSRRSGIVVTSLIIWLVISGLLGFLWFRVVDWSRWETLPSQ